MKVLCLVTLAALVAVVWAMPLESDHEPLWQYSGKFEGDILLHPSQEGKVGMTESKYYWPRATLYYEISPEYGHSEKSIILDAIKVLETRTCINIVERTNQEDYVNIARESSGCFATVGRSGGAQILNLGDGCVEKNIIVHEMLHSLGVWHEQSAPERDEYVTIVWKNIRSGKEHNFNKYDSSYANNFGVGYDYGSIMHYTATAFSKNGEKTIIPKDPNAVIGHAPTISDKDIKKLHKMYKCE